MTPPSSPPGAEAPPAIGRKSVYVIFNPVSGQGDPEQRKAVIADALARHGYGCQLIATSREEGARALAERAVRDGAQLLAVSGGDGTVMEALAALVGTDVPVAVLPAGTGNLLSVNLGIPLTVPDAVDVALGGNAIPLDLARTGDGRCFAIMGGMGLDAQVIADADREAKKRLGVLAYFWSALKNLPRRPARVWITLDGKRPLRRRAKTVLVANMGRITLGVEAVPTASPSDGLLDVAVVRTASLGQWLSLVGHVLTGRAQDDPTFQIYQAKRVSIRASRPEPIQFDGEDAGHTRELTVEVVPQAVRVLVPPSAPAARDAADLPALVARARGNRHVWTLAGLALGLSAALWLGRRR